MNDTPDTPSNRVPPAASVSPEPPPQASDVGTLLCATRMRLGKDLQDIAGVLHIRYNFLVAIEDGRYEDLPGQAYAIGFVRAYADHLGLDGDEVVRRYKDETAGIKHKTRYEYPIPAPESGIPSGAMLLVAVVLGMMVYGVWYTMADADRRAADVIQEVPERLAALLDGNATSSEPEVAQADASTETDESPATPLMTSAEDDSDELPAIAPSSVAPPPIETPPMQVADAAPPVAQAAPDQNRPEKTVTVAETAKPATPEPSPSKTPPDASANQIANTPAAVAPPAIKNTVEPPARVEASAPPSSVESKPVLSQPDAAPRPTSPAVKPETAPVAGAVQATGSQSNQARPAAPAVIAAPAATTPAPTPPASRPTAQVAAAGKEAVELRAKSDSWIQIRDGEQLLLTRFLRKGETYKVPDRPGLTLMTLNAGGIDVLVNGEAMPPLGEPGSVARGVALDAQKLRSTAKPAPAN